MKKVALFIATAGPFGYSPFAPGTMGTAAAVPLGALFLLAPWKAQAAALVALYFVFVWAAAVAEEHFGKKDPGQVVCDEVLGYLITVFAFPFDPVILAAGFFVFRAFDIIKPYPIRAIDSKVPGGWGIVSDDALAGVFSNIVLRIFFH